VKKVVAMRKNVKICSMIGAMIAAVLLAGCPMPLETPLLRSVKETVGTATTIPSPPVVTVASPTNDTTPAWSWSITKGAVDIRYQLDVETAGGWTVVGGTQQTSFAPLTALSEGDHILYVQAGNQAGSWSASGSATATIDITAPAPPVVTGVSPTSDVTPTWSWTSGADVVATRYQLDSESAGGWVEAGSSVATYTPATLLDGTYTLYVQAKDAAGNWSTSGSRPITINQSVTDPPVVTGTSPTNDTTPTWSWTIPTNAVDVRYQLDSEAGTWTAVGGTGTTSYTPSPLSEGSHTLYVQAGNNVLFWSASGSSTISIDTTLPTATAQINGGAPYTNTRNVSVALTADDGTGSGVQQMMLSNDAAFTAASWEAFASPRAWVLSDVQGLNTVYVKVRDAAGNESSTQTPSITLDSLKPTAPGTPDLAAADDTGSSNSDNITKNTTGLTFSGTTAEPNALLTLYSDRDGSRGSTTVGVGGAWSIDITLSANTHAITATLTDAAGNVSDASGALAVVVDTTPPTPTPSLLTPFQGQNTGANRKPTFRWTASEAGCTYELQADDSSSFTIPLGLSASTGADVTSYTPAVDMTVSLFQPFGTRYYIRVRAIDTAGNPGASWSPTRYANVGRYDNDFNGDGYSDVVVGAPYHDTILTDEGAAYVYYGGSSMNTGIDVTLTGAAASDYFGFCVACAGDVNGDGYADIIVGAPNNDTGFANAGAAYIFYGGSAMNSAADVIITGAAANDMLGYSVAPAGDVNGDGYADVIVGAPFNDYAGTNAGRAYLFYGASSMINDVDVTLTGATANDNFGLSVASAGDVNSDGYSDVIVGAPYYGSLNIGRAYVYYGGSAMNAVADVLLTGAATNDCLGVSVASAGDASGDGYSDVIVGADVGSSSYAGAAYVYFGGSAMNNAADVVMAGAAANDYFGRSVASAGDVDKDGYADVIVGAAQNNLGAGAAYVYLGGSSMDNGVDVTLTGAAGENLGRSVARAGDLNGDGCFDVVVGANLSDVGGTDAGRAYVYHGSSPTMNAGADVTIPNATAGDNFGYSVY
jgi:hypothetical protein